MGFWSGVRSVVTLGLWDAPKHFQEGAKYRKAFADLKAGKDAAYLKSTYGFTDNHITALNNSLERFNKIESKQAAAGVKSALREFERPGFWNRVGRDGFWKTSLKSTGKAGLIVGVTGAALGGLYFLTRKGKHKYDAREHANDPLPDITTPEMLAMGPADGRMPGEWQNRVAAMRGGQQMGGPINPAQNVAEAQDLGAVPTR